MPVPACFSESPHINETIELAFGYVANCKPEKKPLRARMFTGEVVRDPTQRKDLLHQGIVIV
jgi:hypothetical protein